MTCEHGLGRLSSREVQGFPTLTLLLATTQLYLVLDQHMSSCPTGLHKAKPVETVSLGEDLGTVQNIAGAMRPVCSLLSHNVDGTLGCFQCHFVSHRWDRCVHSWKPHFFLRYFPLKFLGNWCFSGLLSGDDSCPSRP